ncbi:DUF4359 domain-containing protein [Vulcanococcus limneticus]|uniref:DUF4359 domain-containing protein n=1 Tax=Vulcanococcus limneticus TaxID=2170428 RepID=UPI00398BE039
MSVESSSSETSSRETPSPAASHSPRCWRPWLGWSLLLAGLATALAWTNPGPAEFESFAGERLVELAADEVCGEEGLPMLLRLVVRDCHGLIKSQRRALGALAAQATHRYNAGLFSVYATEVGGQELMPGLAVPRYHALTLGLAGQLLVLRAESDAGVEQK